MNGIEFFNELIVLGSLYHMMIFTEGVTQDSKILYDVGWSMDLLLLFQFLVNMIYLAFSYSVILIKLVKMSWLKYQATKRAKVKKEREERYKEAKALDPLPFEE